MNVKAELIRGLTSSRRFIPYWYQYDDKGTKAFVDSADNNDYYYLPMAEKQIIQEHVKELLEQIPKPYLITDLGCGNAEKCHYFFKEYFNKEEFLKFVPVDMCQGILNNVKETMHAIYGDTLEVIPISGEFFTSLPQLFSIPDKKLIISFGTVQNMIYDDQIKLLTLIAVSMTKDDRIIMTLDTTQDKEIIEKAYMDPSGYFDKQSIRGIERLNEEEGANFDLENFVIEGEYILNKDNTIPGALHMWLRSLISHTVNVDDLDIEIKFDKDDRLYIAEDGDTFKYTDEQIEVLLNKSELEIVQIWKNQHCALLLLKKQN